MRSRIFVFAAVVLFCTFLSRLVEASARLEPTAQKKQEGVSPHPGVSPARPDIQPPVPDENWYCQQCQSQYPFPKRHYKEGTHRPMLVPRAGEAWDRAQRLRKTRGGIVADRLLRQSRKLGLSDDQITRLKDLAYETRKKMIDLRAGLQKEQLELKHLMQSGTEDMRRIRRQLDLVAKKRADLQEARIAHWIASKNVLSEEQREMIKQEHPRLDRFGG
jgi:Spy/CpxP family protein refolding chaperone